MTKASGDTLAPASGIRLDEAQKIAWLRLIRSENVGPATFFDAINHFGTAAAALESLPKLMAGKSTRITSQGEAEEELERLSRINGRIVCFGEPDYPPALRAADAPPPVLSVAGDSNALTRHAVAIVGSRNCSLAGIKFTKALAEGIGSENYTIASGLARGIDSAAHEAGLTTGTVAVFAGGLDVIYPPENEKLAYAIADKGGALVTEMAFGWKPRAKDFPRRNRIVAGMALGLVVVEAARRSGSLISARLANEMGRIVMAVPGSPLDPRSEGGNHLIRQGATLVTSADDVLEAVNLVAKEPQQSTYSVEERENPDFSDTKPDDSDREKLLAALGHAPTDIDELIRFTGIAPGALQLLILQLSLEGRIERHWGNRISLL